MSKKKNQNKKKTPSTADKGSVKKIVTSENTKSGKKTIVSKKDKLAPTSSKLKSTASLSVSDDIIYSKKNYQLMLGGIVLIAIGFLLMLGGNMPSPDVWEPERIYSFRRITLAPIVILCGLGLEIYAIFKKA